MNTSMYSQAAFEAVQQEQMAELEERLAGDTTVVSARQKLANAQASLDQLQSKTRTLPYEQRVKWLNDITAQKEAIRDAKKELQVAVNDNAKMYHRVKLEEQRAQEEQRVAERQAQRAAAQEQEAKAHYRIHFLAAGGTAEQFEQSWPGLWTDELRQRATEQVVKTRNAHYEL